MMLSIRHGSKKTDRRARLAVAASLVVALAVPLTSVGAGRAAAAPGSPGVPSAPVEVFTENFENVASPTQSQYLNTYVGASPLAMTYTADPAWISGPACNGVIASYNNVAGGTCSTSIFNAYARTLAKGLGDRFGGGANNHSVTDVTVSGFPAPSTPAATLETTKPIPLSVSNRFIAFSVDVAVTGCNVATPRLRFFLLNGGQAVTLNDVPINPCTLPGGQNVTVDGRAMRVGSFATDNSLLFSGSEIGVRLTNDQTSGNGNDYAIDNIRILDATPQLDKVFESQPGGSYTGDSANLTFTVTNTSELAEKTGWSFTDDLPDGLEISGAASTDCADGDVTAPQGGDTISVADGSIASGDPACTITVPVTSDEPGSFTNGPGNVSTVGLNPPGFSTIRFIDPDPSMSLVKSADLQDDDGNDVADPGEDIDYTFTVTNTGNTPLTDVTIDDPRVAATTPASRDIPVGGVRTFTATYEVTQADVDAGSVPNTAAATGRDPRGGRVGSNESRAVVPTADRDPRLVLDKTSDLDDENGNGRADVGEEITYSFDVRNDGNVTIDDVAIDDSRVSGTSPAQATLAPGQTRTFVANVYTVTQADVNIGQVYNQATAAGTSPLGPVESAPDEERVDTPDPSPGLTLDKAGHLDEDDDGDGRADVGDVVGYTFTVKNIGNVDLSDVTVHDARVGTVDPGSASIAAGGTEVFTGTYVVTQADVDAGVVRNTATATGVYADPDGPVDVESPPDSDEVVTPDQAPELSIDKSGKLDDENDNGRADVGETIDYSFEVTNTGNTTLTNLRVQDERVEALTPAKVTLAPDASQTFTADPYEVTQADVDAGVVANTATARGNVPNGPETTSPPGTEEVDTVAAAPALSIAKTALLQDEDGNGTADPGEQIVYTFDVTNTGNVTLHDVSVHDERISGLVPGSIDTLAPKATFAFTAEPYTVTTGDVADGEIVNVATAVGTPPGTDDPVESDSDTATVEATGGDGPDDGGSDSGGLLPDTGSPLGIALMLMAGLAVMGGAVLAKQRRTTQQGTHRAA